MNQHQQQQQQGMQMGGQGGPGPASDGQSNSAGAGPEMNLANVLHYLQSEWRRWERDRNEWEIERAEMRVSQVMCMALTLGTNRIVGRSAKVGRELEG